MTPKARPARSERAAQATQVDVARAAGVSTTVVSYVLNNGPRPVAPATRQRVQKAIERLGYRPDAGARALRQRHPRVLGLVVPDVGNPFYAGLTRELELAARARGYAVVLCNALRDEQTERTHVDVLLEHRVAGVLLGGTNLPPAAWQELSRRKVPLVFVNSGPRPGFVTLGSDGARCVHELVTHLIEAHGHRRIGFVGPSSAASTRRAAYVAALEAAGIRPDARWAVEVGYDAAAGYQGMAALLDRLPRAERPTAVFAYNDLLAIGALRCAAERGLRVPGDLAVAGYDGIPLGAFVTPALTTVVQNLRGAAEAALDALPFFAAGGPPSGAAASRDAARPMVRASGGGGRHLTIAGTVLHRESCGCPPPGGRAPASAELEHADQTTSVVRDGG